MPVFPHILYKHTGRRPPKNNLPPSNVFSAGIEIIMFFLTPFYFFQTNYIAV